MATTKKAPQKRKEGSLHTPIAMREWNMAICGERVAMKLDRLVSLSRGAAKTKAGSSWPNKAIGAMIGPTTSGVCYYWGNEIAQKNMMRHKETHEHPGLTERARA